MQNSNIGQIKSMMNMMRNSGNPQAMMQSLMSQNPQMKQIVDMVNQSGGDPQKLFYEEAKKRGIDPNQILDMFK